MSILKQQVNSSSDFSSFFSVITYNASVSLLLVHFRLWTKGSHDFGVFKCSDENLPNCSCYFPNHKSVFLQILHDSSVSWNIFLCIFLSQMLYTLHRGTNQSANFLGVLVLGSKFIKFLSFFETKNKFLFKFLPLFGIMRHNSSMLF